MLSYRSLLTLVIIIAAQSSVLGTTVKSEIKNSDLASRIPLSFTSNMGQWDDTILFRTETNGVTVWFTQSGSYYQLPTINSKASDRPSMINARYQGSHINPTVRGREELSHKSNFFLGDNQDKWTTNVPNYEAIVIENLYDGINLKYYGNEQNLEYDYILAPGADPSQIRIKYLGAVSVSIDPDGSLIISTRFGELREQPPFVFQTIDGAIQEIAGAYRLYDNYSFGFELPDGYDQAYELVIDPVFGYTSYIGVSGNNEAFDVAVDQSGAVILTGYTNSADFTVTDPIQSDFGGGFYDIVVTKLSPNGQSIEFSTYLGGNGDDKGHALTVDTSGDIYLTGVTTSTDFPTNNPLQSTLGGSQDLFVAKLSTDGDQLEYSTYLGGADIDVGTAIEVNTDGNAYLTGYTRSYNFPVTNAFQSELSSTNFDAFVTKLNNTGNAVDFSTFIGGNLSDYGRAITIDAAGNSYILGDTKSIDFPTMNAYQQLPNGQSDIFLVELNYFGNSMQFGTYLGGSGNDYGYGIAQVNGGEVTIAGYTFSTDFPTRYATLPLHAGGLRDGLVCRFSLPSGTMEYSSYLGGGGEDYINAVALNEAGDIYVTGVTYSDDFPTIDAAFNDLGGKVHDPFLTKYTTIIDTIVLDTTISDTTVSDTTISVMTNIEFSSYLGGQGQDIGYGIAIDKSGGVFIAGTSGLPSSVSSPENLNQSAELLGRADIFVTKIYDVSECCGLFTSGATGNVNCSADGKRNLADITSLIDRVYITKNELCCEENGNVNGDPDNKINLADITRLIDHVYVSKAPAANCF